MASDPRHCSHWKQGYDSTGGIEPSKCTHMLRGESQAMEGNSAPSESILPVDLSYSDGPMQVPGGLTLKVPCSKGKGTDGGY